MVLSKKKHENMAKAMSSDALIANPSGWFTAKGNLTKRGAVLKKRILDFVDKQERHVNESDIHVHLLANFKKDYMGSFKATMIVDGKKKTIKRPYPEIEIPLVKEIVAMLVKEKKVVMK